MSHYSNFLNNRITGVSWFRWSLLVGCLHMTQRMTGPVTLKKKQKSYAQVNEMNSDLSNRHCDAKLICSLIQASVQYLLCNTFKNGALTPEIPYWHEFVTV